MGIGRTFGEAYWKAYLGAGMKRLPFGGSVYLAVPDEIAAKQRETLESLVRRFQDTGSDVLISPNLHALVPDAAVQEPNDVDVARISLAIVLGRTSDEDALLRRAVARGAPYISTMGALRGMERALREGVPELRAEAWGTSGRNVPAHR